MTLEYRYIVNCYTYIVTKITGRSFFEFYVLNYNILCYYVYELSATTLIQDTSFIAPTYVSLCAVYIDTKLPQRPNCYTYIVNCYTYIVTKMTGRSFFEFYVLNYNIIMLLYVYELSATTLIQDTSFIAPMCHCVQYILTQSYCTQLSCASCYKPVHHDKLLVTNTYKYTSILLSSEQKQFQETTRAPAFGWHTPGLKMT